MNTAGLTEIRRYLHRHPNLSGQEGQTKEYLKSQLKTLNCDKIMELGENGLAVFYNGKERGNRILLRADMDALPIQETNNFEYRSIYDGISHKCGHDGHSAIMLGVAKELSAHRPERGQVCLIFQPAEENGTGAKAILEDGKFSFKADQAFALHNLPGFERHHIICKKNAFTAAVKSVIFKLYGKTSHAAEPEKGVNPGMAISEILRLSEKLSIKETHSTDFRLISTVYLTMGNKAYGISAGYGEVHLTLRTWNNENMRELDETLKEKVADICKAHRLELQIEYLQEFQANQNDEGAFAIIKSAALENDHHFEEIPVPFKWGEDFGLFTQKFKGAMFGIGAGKKHPALHNPDYDFPDGILETGVGMFTAILRKAL